jgi:hypothetical protein
VLDRLAAGGHQVRMTEEAFGQTLHVANPDAAGTTLWISRRLPEG